MRTERREKTHTVLVAANLAEAKMLAEIHAGFGAGAVSDYSLLRMSVPARLSIVLGAAALLWIAVWWALH